MNNTDFRELMDRLINEMPTCRRGTGATDFPQAQAIFRQYGLQLDGHHLPYLPPTGGVLFVQDRNGTTQGAAVIKRFDAEAVEVRMALQRPIGFRTLHYAEPLLSEVIKLARGLGYQTLTTGNLKEDDPDHSMGLFYYQNGFKPVYFDRPRSILDDGSYLELKLQNDVS